MPEMKSPELRDTLLGMYSSLFNDIGLGPRDLKTLVSRVQNEGISFLTKTLPSLGKSFDKALSDTIFHLPCSFKKKRRDKEIPAFCGSLFLEVFHWDGNLRDDADPVAVRHIRQICYLAYKLVLPFDEDIVTEKFNAFIATDESLSNVDIDQQLMWHMADLTAAVFRDYSWEHCRPKHGPGVTSDVPTEFKSEHVPHPSRRVYRHFGPENWVFQTEQRHLAYIRGFVTMVLNLVDYNFENLVCEIPEEPKAKVIAVPKDSRGPRIISAEPCANQYIQQGMMNWTVNCLERHPLTAGRINFSDQTVNQFLAVIGSTDQSWSTLDLKDASDRVSLDLVAGVFASVPSYLNDMIACRTTHTVIKYPDGSEFTQELKKFAPMGSALCFTTLAWVAFSSVVCYLNRFISMEEALSSVTVYGDDVCVKTIYAGLAIDALEKVGLLVNKEKSFIDSRFCESCGVDAFDGHNVSPVRAKRVQIMSASSRSDSDIISTVELANNLHKTGYHYCAEFLFRICEKFLGPLPFGSDSSGYLCRRVDNFQTYYNNEKLRNTNSGPVRGVKAWTVQSVEKDYAETGYGRLRRTLKLLGQELVIPGYGLIVLPRTTKLVRRFVRTDL